MEYGKGTRFHFRLQHIPSMMSQLYGICLRAGYAMITRTSVIIEFALHPANGFHFVIEIADYSLIADYYIHSIV